MRGVKINLSEDENRVLELFLNNYDTNSKPVKTMMTQVYKTFMHEVGLRKVLPKFKIDRLPEEDLEYVYTQDIIDGWLNLHEKTQSNNNCRLFLRKFLDFIGTHDLVIKKVKKHKTLPKTPPTRDQTINIIKKAKEMFGEKFAYYLKMVDLCGLRKAEGLFVRPLDIEYINNTPRIRIHGKGKRQRWVVIPLDFYEVLIRFIIRFDIKDSESIFDFDYVKTQIMFSKACVKAGYVRMKEGTKRRFAADGSIIRKSYMERVPLFSIHRLRHGFATKLNEQGEQLTFISRILGHSSVTTTQLYINIDDEKLIASWSDRNKEQLIQRIMDEKKCSEDDARDFIDAAYDSIPERQNLSIK